MFRVFLDKIKRKPLIERLKSPIIFIHLEKTAGTTFRLYIESLFPEKNLIAEPYYNTNKPIAEFFGNRLKQLYIGHVPYSACKELDVKGYYLTFLRQPLERAFSLYRFWKDPALLESLRSVLPQKQINIMLAIQEMSFQEYVMSEDKDIYDHIDNLMSRRLAIANKKGQLQLDKAYEILEKNFCWFGITEEFDKSIQMLNYFFLNKTDMPSIQAKNVSAKYDNTLDEKGKQRLKELNEYDLILYEKARALFDERYQVIIKG